MEGRGRQAQQRERLERVNGPLREAAGRGGWEIEEGKTRSRAIIQEKGQAVIHSEQIQQYQARDAEDNCFRFE